jgi:hypothetical protein
MVLHPVHTTLHHRQWATPVGTNQYLENQSHRPLSLCALSRECLQLLDHKCQSLKFVAQGITSHLQGQDAMDHLLDLNEAPVHINTFHKKQRRLHLLLSWILPVNQRHMCPLQAPSLLPTSSTYMYLQPQHGLILAHPLAATGVEATIRVRQLVVIMTLDRQLVAIQGMGHILHALFILLRGLQGLLVEEKPLLFMVMVPLNVTIAIATAEAVALS